MKKFILIAVLAFATTITGFALSPEKMNDAPNIEQFDDIVMVSDVIYVNSGVETPNSVMIFTANSYDLPVIVLNDVAEHSVINATSKVVSLEKVIVKNEVLVYRQSLYKQRTKMLFDN